MDEINESTVQGIIEKIRQGTYTDVYLSLDPDGNDRKGALFKFVE